MTALMPSPTASGCEPFDLSKQSDPLVMLAAVDPLEGGGIDGLNGSSRLGDELFDAGPWHQPAPGAALSIDRDVQLVLTATLDDAGVAPTCLSTIQLSYAPFSATASIPAPGSLVDLSTKSTADPISAFRFRGPGVAGEWIVKAVITFPTDPGPSSIESFFRLRVDAAAPTVGGKGSRPYACGTPGPNPPTAYLSAASGPRVPAQRGTSDWRNVSADGPPPPGNNVSAHLGDRLTVSIEDNVCAGFWGADLAPVRMIEWVDREPFLDILAGHPDGEAAKPLLVNRLVLADLPAGDWWVGVFLEFPDPGHQTIGSTSNYWHVTVH